MAGRRAALLGAVLAIFVAIFTANAPTPLYVYYQAAWGFSSGALAGAYAIFAVGVLSALFIAAPVTDRLGRRRMLLPGMGFVATSCVLFMLADSLLALLVARFVSGLGTGTVTAAAAAALVESHPSGNHRTAALIATLTFALAACTGPALASLLLYIELWPAVLPFALSLGITLLGIAAMLLAPETAPRAGERLTLRDWRFQRPHVPDAMRLAFIAGALALTLSWMTGGLFASLGPSLARDLLLISNLGLAGLFSAVFQGLGGVSQLYFQPRPVQHTLTLGVPVLFGGMALCVVALALGWPVLFAIGTVLAAFGFGGAFAGGVAVISLNAPPERRGEVFTAFYLVGYVAVSVPALLVGIAADRIGFLAAMTGFLVVVGVGMLFVLEMARRGYVLPRGSDQR